LPAARVATEPDRRLGPATAESRLVQVRPAVHPRLAAAFAIGQVVMARYSRAMTCVAKSSMTRYWRLSGGYSMT
jgi:hypothetical protein